MPHPYHYHDGLYKNMYSEWKNSASHGKDLCDAEGHVPKTCKDDGVWEKRLKFNPGEEEPVVTAANFCNEYLNAQGCKITRQFIAVLDDDVPHVKCKQVCDLFGIY